MTEKALKGLAGHAQRKMHASKLEQLRNAIQKEKKVGIDTGRKCGKEVEMAQRMHPMVSKKIVQLVPEGATNPSFPLLPALH